ncbi:DUF3987 domain-containing protein [Brucella haematophila]
MLDVALSYIQNDIPVFPCRAGDVDVIDNATGEISVLPAKAPLISNGLKGATLTERIVRAWWDEKRHGGAMVGIPTGSRSGIFVLDIDMHRDSEGNLIDGKAALAALEAVNEPLPPTAAVRTAGGGEHRYFNHVEGVRNRGALSKGLDIRGEGGFVIAAGSVTADGRVYEWIDHDGEGLPVVADAPQWLLDLILPPTVTVSPSDWSYQAEGHDHYVAAAMESELAQLASTTEGSRGEQVNASAFSLGQLVGAGALDRTEAERGLFDAALANGVVAKDGEKEIRLKIKRGLDSGMRQPRQLPEPSYYDNDNTPPMDTSALVANARAGKSQTEPAETIEQPATASTPIIEPLDVFAEAKTPSMPMGVFPSVIESFAVARAEQMGVDPGGLAMAALTVCAAAIPDNIALKMKRHESWKESARIWTMVIGDPSTRKSPLIKAASAPLLAIESDLQRDHRAAMRDWMTLDKESKKGKSEPIAKRVSIEDGSPEKVGEVLSNNEAGLALIDDELSGWFARMEKYAGSKGSGADRAFWLKSFGGGSYSVDRVGRGSIWIPNISITLLGSIQPDPLRKIAKDLTDDGLLQRMFCIMLESGGDDRDEPSGVDESVYAHLVRKLYHLRTSMSAGWCFRFSDGAQSFRNELSREHRKLEKLWERINRRLATHIGKFDGLFGRICVLLHVIKNIDGELPKEVDLETATQAHTLLHDYLLKHAIALHFNILGATDMHAAMVDAAGSILTNEALHDVISARLLNRHGTAVLRRMDVLDLERVMQQLDAYSWVEPLPLGRTERAPKYRVNPLVHDRFKRLAAKIAAERKEMREAIKSSAKS